MAILAQLLDDVVANQFELRQGQLTIGRHPQCEICIDDVAVSARHATIHIQSNPDFPRFKEYVLEDLGSTNGTFVNGKQVNGNHRLRHNDQVQIAWNRFKFIDPEQMALEKTAHILPGSH